MKNTINQEPVLTVGAILAAVTALLQFLRVMGWLNLNDEQFNALVTVVGLVLPILGALWARNKVTPLANPKATVENGSVVRLVRADTGQAPPQAVSRRETPQ